MRAARHPTTAACSQHPLSIIHASPVVGSAGSHGVVLSAVEGWRAAVQDALKLAAEPHAALLKLDARQLRAILQLREQPSPPLTAARP